MTWSFLKKWILKDVDKSYFFDLSNLKKKLIQIFLEIRVINGSSTISAATIAIKVKFLSKPIKRYAIIKTATAIATPTA